MPSQDTGTVARLVRDRGFGFLRSRSDEGEYFFHRSACNGCRFEDLTEGDAVRFEPETSSKGPRANNVQTL